MRAQVAVVLVLTGDAAWAGTAKVALLFMTYGDLPLERLWRRWFEGATGLVYRGCQPESSEATSECFSHLEAEENHSPIASQHLFNVYVHPKPDFPGFQPDSIFTGYELSHRVDSRWAFSSTAMYTLVHAAVHNPSNAFFVLLSEACVPLYPATVVYLQLVSEPRSRLNAGCAGAPEFGKNVHHTSDSVRRRLDEEAVSWVKSATWAVLNRKHAEIVSRTHDDFLLSLPDEWYLSTVLYTHNLQNETTCDWQGPTYQEWTAADTDHSVTYHSVTLDMLRRMRLGSSYVGVVCDWEAAISQAADPGRFGDTRMQKWRGEARAFQAMNDTCPLFMRKLAPDGQASFMAALWEGELPAAGNLARL
ncbi:hypothetical protein WJX81_005657 [Elliptochloris bilobata]|uniref:Uncharacterized protein n=1 Tax=Elliptochloris bilobata TaxID=381761 RepID=A0AAW1RMJ3_9CHLO